MHPSGYEIAAQRQIESWKQPPRARWRNAVGMLNWPLDQAGEAILKIPGVGWVIDKSGSALVGVANDAAQWSVRREAIYRDLQHASELEVRSRAEVLRLDLELVDRALAWLAIKYQTVALVEGTGTGLLGLPAIPADLATLLGCNLRAVGEYGTYCGFDMGSPGERVFALHVLSLASSPSGAVRGLAMAQLVKIAQAVARRQEWKLFERQAFAAVLERVARALGIRLTKAKLAEFIPLAGAAVGGGFNAYFTRKVCDAAYHLYRERFLVEKYGPDWIGQTSGPPVAALPAEGDGG